MKRLLPGLVFLAACSTAPEATTVLSESTGTTVLSESTGTPVDQLKPTFQGFNFYGPSCPPNSYAASISPDGTVFSVGFSQFSQNAGSSTGCVAVVDMDIPAGYQLGNPSFVLHTYGQNATLFRTYSFEGAPGVSSFSSAISDDTVLADQSQGIWSPSCGGSQRVRLVAALQPKITGDGMFALDDLDGDVTYRDGADWRRCGDTQPLQAAPGTKGQWCGGAHNRGCAPGLTCNLQKPYNTGTCAPTAGEPRAIVSQLNNKCIDVPASKFEKQARPQMWGCNGSSAQQWTFVDGTVRAGGMCMDVAGANPADGTAVQLMNCNGNRAQQFTLSASGELISGLANKCVDISLSNPNDGAQLIIFPCHGTPNQKWLVR